MKNKNNQNEHEKKNNGKMKREKYEIFLRFSKSHTHCDDDNGFCDMFVEGIFFTDFNLKSPTAQLKKNNKIAKFSYDDNKAGKQYQIRRDFV
jgi:hypothetical protein